MSGLYSIININITPGQNERERGFAWSCNAPDAGVLVYWCESGFLVKEQAIINSMTKLEGFHSNKVTLSGLELNKTYYYYIIHDNGSTKSEIYQFTTALATDGFTFLAITDVQIGKNSMVEPVAMAFYQTLKHVFEAWSEEIHFILSSGDQIEHPDSEYQYALYFAPDIMRSVPVATTVGSHDNHVIYLEHFNLPANLTKIGSAPTGGDYWFTYGEVLFISLDTNDRKESDVTKHIAFMQYAIDSYKKENNGEEPRWKILNFHYLPYAGTDYAVAQELRNLRSWLTPAIAQMDIDVSFNGHQHAYTRTLMMEGEGNANGGSIDAGTAGSRAIMQGYTAIGDNLYAEFTKIKGESFYHTGNTASLGFNPLYTKAYDFEYIAKAEQSNRPTVTLVKVTHDALIFTAYYADVEINEASIFDTFVLKKESENYRSL